MAAWNKTTGKYTCYRNVLCSSQRGFCRNK